MSRYPRTRVNLALPALSVLVAKDFLGIEEPDANNRGPGVEFFQRVTGLSPGKPWCAAFVWGVTEVACAMKDVPNPLRSVRLKGYVQSYYQWARDRGRVVPAKDVGVGDLFVLWDSGLDRYAHIGFVDMPPGEAEAVYTTVEGNTNDDGGREGIKAAQRDRKVTNGTRFIRWSDDGTKQEKVA